MELELAGKVRPHHRGDRRARAGPGHPAGGRGRGRRRLRARRGPAARRRDGRPGRGRRRAGAAGRRVASSRTSRRSSRRRSSRWGRIDGVVHNAGRASAGSIETIDDETWESDFQLKLMAAVRLTRLALPHLRASRGAVLFTLAMSAKAPGASSEPSSVTRAAGMALMKALSKELAPEGIRVNAVLIGFIESGQWVRIAERSGTESGGRSTSASPRTRAFPSAASVVHAEFADLGCFLLSARASYLTGMAINLDGGLSPVGLRLRYSVVALASRWRRRSPAGSRPTAKPSIMSIRVRASTWGRPSPPHFVLAARRADSMSSATTNTTSWSSPMRPAASSPPRNAA